MEHGGKPRQLSADEARVFDQSFLIAPLAALNMAP
jgi:hypothetical protein